MAALALTFAAVPQSANAQSPADKATARDMAIEGKNALDANDFAKAEDLYRRADKLYPAPTLKLGLARALVGQGQLIEAAEVYRDLIRAGMPASDPKNDFFKKALEDGKTELDALEPRIPGLVLNVLGAEGASVTVDDTPYPSAALGVRRVINPGRHVASATKDGYATAEKAFEIAEGQTQEVQLVLKPGGAAGAGDDDDDDEEEEPEEEESGDGGSVLPLIGGIMAGVGAAGLVVGGITGGLAIAKKGELDDLCNGDECDDRHEPVLNDYRTLGTVSTIGFIAGGALAAGGITLIVIGVATSGDDTGGSASHDVATNPWLVPSVAPVVTDAGTGAAWTGAQINVSGAF